MRTFAFDRSSRFFSSDTQPNASRQLEPKLLQLQRGFGGLMKMQNRGLSLGQGGPLTGQTSRSLLGSISGSTGLGQLLMAQ